MATVLPPPPAHASTEPKRIALVIGNATYSESPLKNPVNDARDMAARLKQLGFTVIQRENATRVAMGSAIGEFTRQLTPNSAAVIYYAGHGVQARGRNYLIPVDAQIGDETDLKLQALEMRDLTEALEEVRTGVSFLILDACRNNPFERRVRGTGKGLAAIDAARGVMIAYATAPGSVAADGEEANGVYTAALLRALALPGLKVEEVFKRVRIEVTEKTAGRQTPWESSSLMGDFVFNAAVAAPALPAAPPLAAQPAPGAARPAAPSSDREVVFWESIKASTLPADYEAYLQTYPQGTFAPLARNRLDALKRQQVAAAPAPPPPPPPPPALPPTRSIALDPIDRQFAARETARVREAPDVQSKVAATLREGDTVQVLGKVRDADWFHVERAGKLIGYVATQLLEDMDSFKRRKEAEARQQQAQVAPAVRAVPALPSAPAPAGSTTTTAMVAPPAIAPRPSVPDPYRPAMVQPAPAAPGATPGKPVPRDCDVCPELVEIPAGRFAMGASGEDQAELLERDETPQHEVTFAKPFAMGKYEVTWAQFQVCVSERACCLGDKRCKALSDDGYGSAVPEQSRPAAGLSWNDAQDYVAWLSRRTGKRYRLPTEAEWEYAARAGTSTTRYWGSSSFDACRHANVLDQSYRRQWRGGTANACDDGYAGPSPVGAFTPNPWGLYDMLGNVWEWVEDRWHADYRGAPGDGRAWEDGGDQSQRIRRGGAWGAKSPAAVRAAFRSKDTLGYRDYDTGMRVVRELP